MKVQIKSFSAHQTAKVFAILMFSSMLVIFVPMVFIMSLFGPGVDANGNHVEPPYFFFLAMPFFYLIFGYLMTGMMCKFYNFISKYVGGVEFESVDEAAISSSQTSNAEETNS